MIAGMSLEWKRCWRQSCWLWSHWLWSCWSHQSPWFSHAGVGGVGLWKGGCPHQREPCQQQPCWCWPCHHPSWKKGQKSGPSSLCGNIPMSTGCGSKMRQSVPPRLVRQSVWVRGLPPGPPHPLPSWINSFFKEEIFFTMHQDHFENVSNVGQPMMEQFVSLVPATDFERREHPRLMFGAAALWKSSAVVDSVPEICNHNTVGTKKDLNCASLSFVFHLWLLGQHGTSCATDLISSDMGWM